MVLLSKLWSNVRGLPGFVKGVLTIARTVRTALNDQGRSPPALRAEKGHDRTAAVRHGRYTNNS